MDCCACSRPRARIFSIKFRPTKGDRGGFPPRTQPLGYLMLSRCNRFIKMSIFALSAIVSRPSFTVRSHFYFIALKLPFSSGCHLIVILLDMHDTRTGMQMAVLVAKISLLKYHREGSNHTCSVTLP